MSDLIGTTFGQYVIQEQLGIGGMATVYRARQARIQRDVAIKIIKSDMAQSTEHIRRFQREAHMIAGLSHSHIVKVFDFGEQGNLLYLVMEYLTGGSLDAKIRKGVMPLGAVSNILDQLALALDYAHQKGIVHRDLKPQNILFDEAGNLYLTDFGIAKTENGTAITRTGVAMGTPLYMAPEQWRGLPASPQSDIYAFGAMAYEMLTRRVPYSAPSLGDLMYMHMNNRVPHVSDVIPGFPTPVERVITKVLAKNPEERYRTAQQFADAFRDAIDMPAPIDLDEPTAQLLPVQRGDIPTAAPRIPGKEDSTVLPKVMPKNESTVAPRLPSQKELATAQIQPMPQIEQRMRPARKIPVVAIVGGGALVILAIGAAITLPKLVGSATPTVVAELSTPTATLPTATALTPTAQSTVTTVALTPTLTASAVLPTLPPIAGNLAATDSSTPPATSTPDRGQTLAAALKLSATVLTATASVPTDSPATVAAVLPPQPVFTKPTSLEDAQQYKSIAQAIDDGDPHAPTSQRFTVTVPATETRSITNGWCATTQAILQDNLKNMLFSITINDVPIPGDLIFVGDAQSADKTLYCENYITLVSDWQDVQQATLTIKHSILQRIFDGNGYYEAGDYADVLNVTVANLPLTLTQPTDSTQVGKFVSLTKDVQLKDPTTPTHNTYSLTVAVGETRSLAVGWCAADTATLADNLSAVTFTLSIDNVPIPASKVLNYDYVGSDGKLQCHGWATAISGWKAGTQYTLRVVRALSRPVNDGQHNYAAGQYTDDLNVTVP
jgi:serine/threonine protein kinase